MKISKIIDRTNSITSQVNRFRCGSCIIYVLANLMTFAEINMTTLEKIMPIGSRIKGTWTVVEARVIKFHSISTICLTLDSFRLRANIIKKFIQRIRFIFSDNMFEGIT